MLSSYWYLDGCLPVLCSHWNPPCYSYWYLDGCLPFLGSHWNPSCYSYWYLDGCLPAWVAIEIRHVIFSYWYLDGCPGPPRGGGGGGGQGEEMPWGPATFRGPAGSTVNIVYVIWARDCSYGPVTALYERARDASAQGPGFVSGWVCGCLPVLGSPWNPPFYMAIGIWTVVSLSGVAIEIRHVIFSYWYLNGCLPAPGSHWNPPCYSYWYLDGCLPVLGSHWNPSC